LPGPWANAATKLITHKTAKQATFDFMFIDPLPTRIRSAGLVVCQTRSLSDNTADLGTSPSPALRLRSIWGQTAALAQHALHAKGAPRALYVTPCRSGSSRFFRNRRCPATLSERAIP
jgi:hypothetical protein